jgi:SAM-dependent methyltransferase
MSDIRENIRRIVFSYLGYPGKKLSLLEKAAKPFLVKFLFKQATYGWGKVFPGYKKDGFALDIGCGNGSFLSFLKHHGWKVQGVDFSKKAADTAKKIFDIDVFVGEIDDLPFPPRSFDYINMSHVLEHVTDPLETMKKVKSLLKNDGTVYIEVPNYQSYSRKISKQYWYAWETPRHLYTFSPENLKKLVEAAGFEVVKLDTKIHNLFAWDNTYKREEREGVKPVRPFVTVMDKPKLFFLSLSARFSHLFNRSSGDFICCWATPKN